MKNDVFAGAPQITPQRMIAQWAFATNRLTSNIWMFESKIAEEAVTFFKGAFYRKRLDWSSQKWAPNKRSNELMLETGTLRNSIVWEREANGLNRRINIYTDPNKFNTSASHRGFCYAAIHNAPSGTYTYGKSGAPSIQRQFIGHSNDLDDIFNKMAIMIFNGFPK